MPSHVLVNVELPDVLTASICSHLSVELFKHIAYQKQQLPFPYKHLISMMNKTPNGTDESQSRSELHTFHSVQAGNEFRKVKEILLSMQAAFKNLEDEICHENGSVEEIAMVFGATPFSPRDVYRLQFPPLLHGHLESKHPHQSSLLQLFRCLISSEELHSFFSQPLPPTNMFLLLRKRNSDLVTSGFTPKERYSIPSSGRHAIIKLLPPSGPPKCICGGSNIYQDSKAGTAVQEQCQRDQADIGLMDSWYQSLNSIKGFKDVKINGTSASSVWLQSR